MDRNIRTASRSSVTALAAIASLMLVIALPPSAARASANDVTATMDEPIPNPVPAGTTATASADFTATIDAGPVLVAVELQGSGFGTLRLDAAGTSPELLNCDDSSGTEVICDWDGEVADGIQTLAVFVDVDPNALPETSAGLAATVDDTTQKFTLANVFMSSAPPIGTTTLSGVVITEGGTPVDQACIFVISSPLTIFPAITDASGSWSVTGLPDTYSFVIGVTPPFTGTFGPCAEAGPPPVPPPGELQPVFYDNIWIDLSDPQLTGGLGNPYDFAVDAGATSFSTSTSGLEVCLSTAAFDTVPRPPCVSPATTTTTTTGQTTTSVLVGADTLPFTGAGDRLSVLAGSAVVLLMLGLAAVLAGRKADTRSDL